MLLLLFQVAQSPQTEGPPQMILTAQTEHEQQLQITANPTLYLQWICRSKSVQSLPNETKLILLALVSQAVGIHNRVIVIQRNAYGRLIGHVGTRKRRELVRCLKNSRLLLYSRSGRSGDKWTIPPQRKDGGPLGLDCDQIDTAGREYFESVEKRSRQDSESRRRRMSSKPSDTEGFKETKTASKASVSEGFKSSKASVSEAFEIPHWSLEEQLLKKTLGNSGARFAHSFSLNDSPDQKSDLIKADVTDVTTDVTVQSSSSSQAASVLEAGSGDRNHTGTMIVHSERRKTSSRDCRKPGSDGKQLLPAICSQSDAKSDDAPPGAPKPRPKFPRAFELWRNAYLPDRPKRSWLFRGTTKVELLGMWEAAIEDLKHRRFLTREHAIRHLCDHVVAYGKSWRAVNYTCKPRNWLRGVAGQSPYYLQSIEEWSEGGKAAETVVQATPAELALLLPPESAGAA